MKSLKTILAFALCVPAVAQVQVGVTVSPTTYAGFTQTEVPAFEVIAPNVTRASFMDHWESYLKGKSEVAAVRTERDIVMKNAKLKKLGEGDFNVYLNFEDQIEGTKLIVAVEKVGVGFLDARNPDYGVTLQKLITEECNKVYLKDLQDNLGVEESKLSDLEKELKQKQAEENKISKKIYAKNTAISRANEQIQADKDVITTITRDITRQRGNLSTQNLSAEERKSGEKDLKSLEKKMKSLQKDIDKESREIIDTQTEISELEYEKGKITQDISILLEKVKVQREGVLALRNLEGSLK